MSNLKWSPVVVRLGQVKPWTQNPRQSTKADAERLIQSERELGQAQTIAIGPADSDGLFPLYDGHQRYSAWFTVKGAEFEMNALQCNRPLSEDERRKMSILLHTASGGWAWDKLASWTVGELKEWGLVNKENVKGWNVDSLNVVEILRSEDESLLVLGANDVVGVDEGRAGASPWSRVDGSKKARCVIGDVEFGISLEAYDKWKLVIIDSGIVREDAQAWMEKHIQS